MEIGIDNRIPTFSGGLGVLSGDTILSAADLGLPLVAFTLLYRKGYFQQEFDATGRQREVPVTWRVEDYLKPAGPVVSVAVDGRTVHVRAWTYTVSGISGHTVPIYFLDTDHPDNSEWDRTVTHQLYGGDWYYRLCQEIVLGIGGIRMARALGFEQLRRFHMNEGHAAFATFELLRESALRDGRLRANGADIQEVRRACIFTTHTPVPAGHDRFRLSGVENVVHPLRELFDLTDPAVIQLVSRIVERGPHPASLKEVVGGDPWFNMTCLALNLSGYVNGVARKHGEVSRKMFPGYAIDTITNGVHAGRWTAPPFQRLYDRYIPDWKKNNFALRHAVEIPRAELREARVQCQKRLIDYINATKGVGMELGVLTIGFARRAAVYKRAELLFSDIERLRRISLGKGRIQIVYSGKAHPRNLQGKDTIQRIFQAIRKLDPDLKAVYLEDYDMEIGAMLTAGVDVWLNTPEPPMEASGTSGMKAALNGVPSLSVLDGWWVEGHVEGITGWSIGVGDDRSRDADSLYEKLEDLVVPLFYHEPDRFIEIARQTIALNGSFFTSHRMLQEYVVKAYL